MKKLIITLSIIGVMLLGLTAATYAIAFALIANYSHQVDAPVAPTKVIPLPLATDVEADINAFRVSQGLPVFNTEVPALDEAARVRADAMCESNNWSHDGDWAVLDQYYLYQYAGENLYFGGLQENQAAVALRDWIASPSHLENLVGNYTEIGVAVKSCPGYQGGQRSVIITNFFGVPKQ